MSEPIRTHAFEIRRHIAAPVEQVWELVSRNDRYSEWTPMTVSKLLENGAGDPNGVGALRRLGVGPVGAEERIVGYEPPGYQAYEILKGLPVKDYLAEVRLSASATGGTDLVWSGSFRPKVPGTGRLVAVAVERVFVGSLVRWLARAAERGAASGSQAA